MGSGHILVYAFDVLYEIYLSAGYSEREIPTLILEKNLYGLDIDDRAGQLATFALLMKARSKNRRIFRHKPKMNLCSIQESNDIPKEAIEYLVNPKETELEKYFYREDVEYLIEVFHDAKEYGSILEVKEIDFDALENRIEEIRNGTPENIFELQYREEILEKIPPLIQQAKIMSQKYDVVCTNPPYMGRGGMNSKLVKYLDEKYKSSKNDLFAVFIKNNFKFAKENSFISMITMESWMFLSGFEELRTEIVKEKNIFSLVHMPYEGRGRTSLGINFGTSAFIIRNCSLPKYAGNYNYLRYYEIDEEGIPFEFPVANDRQSISRTIDFTKIPGFPVAYWINKSLIETFRRNKFLESKIEAVKGLDTCDNNTFVRLWYEVIFKKIGMNIKNCSETYKHKWYPYCKGGNQRKWYGNYENVVLWENDGDVLRNLRDSKGRIKSRPQNTKYYFQRGMTWSAISSTGKISMREMDNAIFGGGGSGLFTHKEIYKIIFALLNSKVTLEILKILNPTLNFLVGDLKKIPLMPVSNSHKAEIDNMVDINIKISKTDWDSFETSWDFKKHPLLTHKKEANTIEGAFNNWSIFAENQFIQLKANEEELNRIFIDIYGLQDELTPDVNGKDVTITRIYDSKEDIPESMKGNNYVLTREDVIKSFISYAIGCMFGRYSLDEEGLIYAGGDFDDKFRIRDGQWEIKTKEGWKKSSINIVEHNVIPIADGDYFEDGILERFVEFVEVSFGEETLEKNLDYIAETLGKRANETSRQAIRRYFLKDFYKDHVKTYKKRPIYWLFDSGRQDGFKALIYMHRYDPYTVARVRTDYLHSLQKKYEAEINHLDILIDSDISQREKAATRKRKETILKQIEECRLYDEAIAHMANQRIEIDLDDGVKVNYAKFQGVEIPQGKGRKPLKADLLAKI
jgi:hypothetical protein